MTKILCICLLFGAILVSACGQEKSTQAIQPATQIPEKPTSLPIPIPTPTKIPMLGPTPGATFAGPLIFKGDQEGTAMLNFQVSEDGTSISKINLSFINLKCGDFSTGLMITQGSSTIPIVQGKFKGKVYSRSGEIEGEFGSPTTAGGLINLQIDLGFGGDPIDCGTAEFLLMLSKEQSEPVPSDVPPKPTQPAEITPTILPPLLAVRDLPGGDTPVVNVYSSEDRDDLLILGEVENRTGDFIHNLYLTAVIYNPGGSQVAEVEEHVEFSEVPPGERAPFLITVPKPDSYAGFSLKVDYASGGSAPPAELRIVDQVIERPPHGHLEVSGMVENDTPDNLQHVMVVGVFYDALGRVIGVGSNFPVGPDAIILPGKRAPFNFNPEPFEMGEYADYRLIMTNNHTTTDLVQPDFEIVSIETGPGFLRGEVLFPGPGTADLPIMWVATFDDQGKLIEVAMGYIDPYPLGAGEKGTFEIQLDHEEYATYELYSEYFSDQ